ncbi:hypothetical protein KJY73_15835 [Bowmanella sp. Y26]|uniref:Uncharacterized protein n=1 Tax=Bowmanella yangjiangensis TaxID=2811230 RepID=A0ABS3CYJ5_9ALTE|nr:hypothetical protein [Bowmanella yangjiangensis]MBN7821176.1 hypothetical protein [Bowmanella yangjiangensis]MBT1065063.1 hypothetical protein [Bowmanella yangjiangensis]
MAVNALLTSRHQPGVLELSMYQGAQLRSLMQHFEQQGKWVYLLSNSLKFKRTEHNSQHLAKPDADKTLDWLEKLITAGKTCALFVEELFIDELSRKRLEQLCRQFSVTVVNISKEKNLDSNLIFGPW